MNEGGNIPRQANDDAAGRRSEARHWSVRSPHEIAAQGHATLLELQRLQQAFDREFPKTPTARSAEVPADDRPDVRSGGIERYAAKIVTRGKVIVGYLRGLRAGRDRVGDPGIAAADLPTAVIVDFPAYRTPERTPRSEQYADPTDEAPPPSPAARSGRLRFARPARLSSLVEALRQAGRDAPDILRDTGRAIAGRSMRLTKGLLDLASRPGTTVDIPRSGVRLAERVERSLAKEFRVGLAVFLAGASTIGVWSVMAPLAGAVTIPGSLVVETNVKKVQHPTGGTVAAIVAHDGMHVQEGEPVMRLDGTQTRTNYQLITKQFDQIRVHIARLVAERDGADEPAFPSDLVARADADDDVKQLLASEQSLFGTHRSSQQNQKDLLRNHIVQFDSEIDGLKAQIKSDSTQADLTDSELKGVETLHDRQLVPLQRVTTLQREAARLDGSIGQMTSSAIQAQAKIAEAKLQIDQIDQLFRSEVLKELRETQDKAIELTERRTAARDQLDRVEIRAPVSGTVQDLAVHTIGGVISPAEMIMEIVPDNDDLQVEARVPPNEIDHVRLGQAGLIRFSAFNQRTTPQLRGAVSYVSADLVHDSRTNAAFYTVKVDLSPDQRRRLGSLQLVSGMPAEVFLQTGSRSMVSYLFKPIGDQLKRTFSEP